MRDIQLPGRSVVHSRHGAAATSHPLSTLAAIDILRQGGNAVDAAVAAAALQGVVEPMSTGIGGDCFALYWPARQGKVIGINGSGRAPAGLSADWLKSNGHESIGLDSVHSVTIPGAVNAWSRLLKDHGKLGFAEVLRPAIDAAANGFAVTPRIAIDWSRGVARLARNEVSARTYLPGGRSPNAGEVHCQPELAATLREIAAHGRDGFYTGRVAADMVAGLKSMGGTHTLEDFATQDAYYAEPISTRYRDVELLEIPPNGHGIAALMMLNILGGYDLGKLDPNGADRLHLEIEAQRLAFQARDTFVADPNFASVPVEYMLSAKWADEARAKIDLKRSMPPLPPMAGPLYRDTVYLTVVDAERNVCSFINSLFFGFGSAITSPSTGVLFQNRGAGFRVSPGHPNNIEPRKRPLHTIIPGMAMKGGKPWLSFGVMGGHYQPLGHVHVLSNMVDYGMDVQEALDSARVFHAADKLEAERGVPEQVRAALAAKGHNVAVPDMPWGGGQAIMLDYANGTLAAGSDPRKDGCALGY